MTEQELVDSTLQEFIGYMYRDFGIYLPEQYEFREVLE